jgi:hypothetical protein
MNTTMDIIKSAETQDAASIQDSVSKALSAKAFAKLEDMKRDIASNLLVPTQTEGDE